MTDVKKLRELAEKATFPSSEWDSEQPASDEWKGNKQNNLAWCRAANPQAIIEILDRLERYEKALRFYATAEYVDVKNRYGDPNDPDLEEDDGSIARKALEGGK